MGDIMFLKKSAVSLFATSGLLLITLLSGCSKKEVEVKIEAPRPVLIQVLKAEQSIESFSLPAETRARIETRYGFRVGGKLSQRLVAVGDQVTAGQLLARLDPQDLAPNIAAQQALLDGAKVELRLASADLQRTKDLRDKNFVSQAQVERQQAVTEGAQAKLQAAQAQLKQALNGADFQALKADKAGVIVSVEAEVGQVVAAGQIIYRIAQAGERDFLVNVPESQLQLTRNIKQWVAVIPSMGSQSVSAVFRELSPIADAASRTYPMKLSITGSNQLPLGLTAVVRPLSAVNSEANSNTNLGTNSETSFVIPLSALYSKDGNAKVWLVDSAQGAKEGTVRLVAIKTNGFTNDGARVSGGLKVGDKVVIAGANLLVAGQKVKLQ
jgi:membrane fusion protein, multidrug efflux system